MKEKYRDVDGPNPDDLGPEDYEPEDYEGEITHSLASASQKPDRYNFAEREEQIREENFKEEDLFRILEEYGY